MILPEPWVQSGPFNDEIWYTSSDGNIVSPFTTSALPTIVSNAYVNGKGVIKFASDVTSIGMQAFYYRTNLTSITIPNIVTSIGQRAFYYCGVTSVTIPDSITSIGDEAFSWCRGLSSVTIPNSVTSIGNATFYTCRGLTSITIPDSVTSVGQNTFMDCIGLTSVTIGNGVTSIGMQAFYNCSSLTSISYTGTIAQYNAITKSTSWNYNVPTTVVHCTDGDTHI